MAKCGVCAAYSYASKYFPMDQYCKRWSKFSDLHGKGKIYRTSAVCCRVDHPRPKILDKPLKARSKLISIDLLLSLTIITVRNVVAARLCFAQVSVILFTGRDVCIPVCTGADTPQADTPGADSPREAKGHQPNFSEKLHGNEQSWTERGRPKFVYVDPSLILITFI